MFLKIQVFDPRSEDQCLYRTVECSPECTVADVLHIFKEHYNYTDSFNCSWALYKPLTSGYNTSNIFKNGTAAGNNISTIDISSNGDKNRGSKSSVASSSDTSVTSTSGGVFSDGYNFLQSRTSKSNVTPISTTAPRSSVIATVAPPQGQLLDAFRRLEFYNIQSMAVLELRNCMRSFKVTAIDDSLSKTVSIKLTNTSVINDLFVAIAVRFNISEVRKFALQVYRGSELVWLDANRLISHELEQQEDRIVLRQRFILDNDLESKDPHAIDLLYLECKHSVIKGCHSITLSQAIELAAIQMQITYSSYDPLIHVAGFLNNDEFLPLSFRKMEFIEEELYKEHRKLKDMSEQDAKMKYIKTLKTVDTYGLSSTGLNSVKEKIDNSQHYNHDVFLGVTNKGLLCLHPQSKEVLSMIEITNQFEVDLHRCTLHCFGNGSLRKFQFSCVEEVKKACDEIRGYLTLLENRI